MDVNEQGAAASVGCTPGPWEHRAAGPNHWVHAQSDGRCIAFIGGSDSCFTRHPGTPHGANAALIAAAPDLADALAGLLAEAKKRAGLSGDKFTRAISAGEDALAKTGRVA